VPTFARVALLVSSSKELFRRAKFAGAISYVLLKLSAFSVILGVPIVAFATASYRLLAEPHGVGFRIVLWGSDLCDLSWYRANYSIGNPSCYKGCTKLPLKFPRQKSFVALARICAKRF
jgi:hypothetical protein